MLHLPREIVDLIYQYDDNSHFKNIYNKSLYKLLSFFYKNTSVSYISHINYAFNIYTDYHFSNHSKMKYYQYVLSILKSYKPLIAPSHLQPKLITYINH